MKVKETPKKTAAKEQGAKPATIRLPKEKQWQVYLLLTASFVLYFNSLFNQYAFDDSTYILENSYVQQGFQGIGKILTSDALESYIKGKGGTSYELSGGRYRPLSLVSFAIEKSLFNGNPFISHLINVLLYLLTVALLYKLLAKRFFVNQPWGAFLAALIFTIHPLHTEVVANIKSRDEIFSLLFIVLSLEYFLKAPPPPKGGTLTPLWGGWGAWLFFFLAMLSKEYGLFLVLLIPAVSYVMLKKSTKESFLSAIPFLMIATIYLFIRISVSGFRVADTATIVNNPYLLASGAEKIATKLFVLLYYIKLLIIPFPLSCDYSYNTFPYRSLSDPFVILSILFYGGLIALAFYWLKRKNILSIALLIFILPLILVSNLLVDIGATMGERLVYHSSVGFAMIVGCGFFQLINKIILKEQSKQTAIIVFGTLLTVSCAFIVIPRNAQWKNSATLFTHDVQVVPNSLLMNHNAALKLMEEAADEKDSLVRDRLFQEAVSYLKHDLTIYPKWEYIPVSLGAVYYRMGQIDSATIVWKQAAADFPGLEIAKTNLSIVAKDYFNQAVATGKKGDWNGSLYLLKKAIDVDSTNTTYWYNLGGIYYTQKDYANARLAWQKTLMIDPNFKDAKGGLQAISGK